MSKARHRHSETSPTGGQGLDRVESPALCALDLLNAPRTRRHHKRDRWHDRVAIEPVSAAIRTSLLKTLCYSPWKRNFVPGDCRRTRPHSPKISVSLGLILRSECASAGYVGDIQRDWKSCNIKYLRGGAERIRTSDLRTAKPRSALPLGDVACEFVSRTASRPDDEQLFSSVSNPQPSPQRDGSARLAAKMNGTERFARHDAAPTPDRLRAGFGLASS